MALGEARGHDKLPSTPMTNRNRYIHAKRVLDFLIAFVLVIVFAPWMMLIAIAIKLKSPGPVLYRQERIGKSGRSFYMLKFRSMRVGNSEKVHREYVQQLMQENLKPEDLGATSLKLGHDERVTGIGKVLRKLSLDELPQLMNVIRGEMSLVGPRPPLPYEYELYEEDHKRRLEVLPGITGLWQVTCRNRVSFEEMVAIDLDYIVQMSLWLDLSIMLRTPFEMIRGKGGG